MIAILACDRNRDEKQAIETDCKLQVAKKSDEALRFSSGSGDRDLVKAMQGEELVDLLYYEFQKGQSLESLREFRKIYQQSMFMLITEPTVSPLEYLRPGVTPDSLLLRPVGEAQLKENNREFMGSFFERFKKKEAEDSFVVDTREEKVFIPYAHILYFEARDKKLFVRTRTEEYPFYDTIEALEKKLPEYFRRCHRSFIVNTQRINRIIYAESYIELTGEIGIPISRSYKSGFRNEGR